MSEFVPAARIVADSVSAVTRDRMTTLEVVLPRTVLPYLLIESNISRSFDDVLDAPVADNMKAIADSPAVPIYWPAASIQTYPAAPLRTPKAHAAREAWLRARDEAVGCAETLTDIGAHHTIANRLLEPFLVQRVLLSSTEWRSVLAGQRRQITHDPLVLAELTEVMESVKRLLEKSQPEELNLGQWHLPYIRSFELRTLPARQAIEVSIARCHYGHDLEADLFNIERDLDHYRQLAYAARPVLAPMEHVCTPAAKKEHTIGSLRGWHQYRYHRGDQ